jgi:DNA replication protein DnaC
MVKPVKQGLEVPAHLAEGVAAVGEPDLDVEVGPSHTETVEQARERLARKAAARSARWHERMPAEFADAVLEDFAEGVASRLRDALTDPRVLNVVLAGNVGTGKTRAAYAMGRLAVSQGRWVEAWSLHDLMHELMPSGAAPAHMEHVAKECDVLVLDDLGAGKASEWAVDNLTSVVDARVAHHRLTVVTTNVTEEALRAVWQDRLMDRLRDRLVAIPFTGPSRRKPAW